MAFEKKAMVLMVVVAFMAALQLSQGVVYKVGDSTGWTTLGNYNYSEWSSTKTFRVGDTIVFEYNTQFHDVLQVNYTHFKDCNVSAPLRTYTSGNDSITITKTGHYYFVCGVPGHCQIGQKVDIRVPGPLAMAPSSSMSPSSSMPPSADGPGGSASADGPNGAMTPGGGSAMTPGGGSAMTPGTNDTPHPSKGVLSLATLAVAVFAGFVTL